MPSIISRYKGLPREIYILFFARIINSIGAFVHPLLTLIMTDKLGMSAKDAGLFMTILLLTQLPTMLLGGKLADRFGRVKLLVVFQLLGAATYLVCGFIETSNVTIYLIVLASNFYAITYPAISAMAMDLTHAGNRKHAFGLLYMGLNIGFAVGPMIGGLLFKNYLHFVFIGDALTSIASIVLILVFVKETLLKKTQTENNSKLEKFEKGSVIGILLKRKVILVVALILFLFSFSYAQMGFALPIQMESLFINGAFQFGLLVSFNGVLVIFFTPLITTLIAKWKPLYGTFAGGLLYAAAFAVLIFAKGLLIFYLSMFLLTMGEIICAIDAYAFLADVSPASHRGRLNSVVNMISNGGRMISPLIIGQVIATGGLAVGWLSVSAASLLGAVLLISFMNNRRIKKQINMIED
ncbi:MAG: MFS transporter [Clostridia bacterium]|jgi:MFS family permease|nr:MFS transporter [Clostridia bacterium]MBT7121438.1 MFS transporter [Clostridia bacterium]